MMKSLRFNLLIIFLLFCALPIAAKASFGTSCALVPGVINATDTLNTNTTAFGYLKNYIQAPVSPDNACSDNSADYIVFNLKTKFDNSTPAVQVKLGNGYSGTIGQAFAGLSDIATDPVMQNISLVVQGYNSNTLCLFMPTTFGNTPVFCKAVSYIQTPDDIAKRQCSIAATSCSSSAFVYSMSPFNFTGKAYQCLTENLNKIFYLNTSSCTSTTGLNLSLLNPFVNFQNALRGTVGAALLLYVMFFGIRLTLGEVEVKKSSFVTLVMKVILVSYFAIGLGPISYMQGNQNQQNGVVTWGLPLLNAFMTQLPNIVFNAGGAKGLCNFDAAQYKDGQSSYAIWDSIDCRIGYYFGIKMLYGVTDNITKYPKIATYNPNGATAISFPDNTNMGPPALVRGTLFTFFTTMFGALLSGDIIAVMVGMIFALLLISIVLSFFSSILVCIMTLYAMLYVAPIFVPMALFERTKGNFESWLKMTISMVVQPAIFVGFLSIMTTIYDSAIYNNCEFIRETYAVPSQDGRNTYNMNIYRVALPNINPDLCQSSYGVKMMRYYMGNGWQKMQLFIMEIPQVKSNGNMTAQMILLMIISCIFYFFAQSVQDFAGELSGGPSTKNVSLSVGAAMKGLVAAFNAMKFAAETYASKGQNIKNKMQNKLNEKRKELGVGKGR